MCGICKFLVVDSYGLSLLIIVLIAQMLLFLNALGKTESIDILGNQ